MGQRPTLRAFDPKKIDAIFAPLDQCRLPGAAVGIAVDGVPVYRRGFGLASMNLPVLLGPAIRMRIGSTTKHMTALAFLLLCEEGRATIDDEVGKHLPELNDPTRRITMRHLLGHTSGIRDIVQLSMFMHGIDARLSDAEMLDYYRTIDDVEFAPGESWSYNNGGYLLVTAVIERLTGQSLEEVLSGRIFRPLGMYDTQLQRWDNEFLPNCAAPHMIDGKGGFTKAVMAMELTGAGGVISTMDDMLRWLRHMESPVVGSAATWELMKNSQRLGNGSFSGYGTGLIVDRYRGVDTLSHPGGVFGGNSQMIRVPAAKLDITIAVNRADANAIELANRVIDACIDGLEAEPAAAASEAAASPAIYLSERSGRVIQLSSLGAMSLVSVDGGMPMPIVHHQAGAWRLAPMFSLLKYLFQVEEGWLRFSDFGNEDLLEQIQPSGPGRVVARAGKYECEAIGFTARIVDEEDGARLETHGRHGRAQYDLTALTADVWHAKSRVPLSPIAGMMLTFTEGGAGFLLTGERMRRLRFERAEEQS